MLDTRALWEERPLEAQASCIPILEPYHAGISLERERGEQQNQAFAALAFRAVQGHAEAVYRNCSLESLGAWPISLDPDYTITGRRPQERTQAPTSVPT